MTTAATSLLGLALPVTGELQGTWGTTVNDSITSLLDTAVAGTTTLSTDGDVTLSTTTLAANQARQAILLCSGARTAIRTITAPAQSKIYTIINATTGGYAVKLVGVGPTTGLTIPNGASAVVAWNGSDFIEIGSSTIGNLTVNGNLTVTGTSTLTGAATLTANPTLSAGTANGVAYLNGSKVVTTGSALTFDGTLLTNSGSAGGVRLAVVSTGSSPEVSITSADTGTSQINFGGATTPKKGRMTYSDNSDVFWWSLNNGSEQMRLTSTGLGIGTSSPAYKLDVSVTGNNGIRTTSSAGQQTYLGNTGGESVVGTLNNYGFGIITNGLIRGYFDSSGNLGIGTSSPGYKLDVVTASGPYTARFRNSSTSTSDYNVTLWTQGAVGSATGYAGTGGSAVGNNSFANNFVVGTQTANALVFNTNDTERARISSTGIWGINTTPSAWASSVGLMDFRNNGALSSDGSYIYLSNNIYYDGTNNLRKSANPVGVIGVGGASGVPFVVQYAGTGAANSTISLSEALRVDGSGNLLVGQTSATGKASITGTGSGNTGILAITATDSSSTFIWGAQIYAASMPSGSNLIHMIGQSGSNKNAGYIGYKWSSSGSNSNLLTFGHYGSDNLMNLTADGNLLVGTTTAGFSNSNSYFFNIGPGYGANAGVNHVSGTASGIPYLAFGYNGSGIGSITQSGTTAVLYNVTSDERLKENISDSEDASELIDSLQVRQFDWKADGNHQRYGFVAQELVTVAPEAVHQPADPDEMMAVDYSKLVPMLVKEIQSLRQRVAQLEGK